MNAGQGKELGPEARKIGPDHRVNTSKGLREVSRNEGQSRGNQNGLEYDRAFEEAGGSHDSKEVNNRYI